MTDRSLAKVGDVVVVTVQYRFGPSGYLDFSQYSSDVRPFEDNLGLRDQVASLEWCSATLPRSVATPTM